MGLISRKALVDLAKSERKTCGKDYDFDGLLSDIENAPTVPSVPLEPLAKWIAENLDPRCGCSYCSRDRVCCDCPTMTEQQVKEELTKFMEEQDADRQ